MTNISSIISNAKIYIDQDLQNRTKIEKLKKDFKKNVKTYEINKTQLGTMTEKMTIVDLKLLKSDQELIYKQKILDSCKSIVENKKTLSAFDLSYKIVDYINVVHANVDKMNQIFDECEKNYYECCDNYGNFISEPMVNVKNKLTETLKINQDKLNQLIAKRDELQKFTDEQSFKISPKIQQIVFKMFYDELILRKEIAVKITEKAQEAKTKFNESECLLEISLQNTVFFRYLISYKLLYTPPDKTLEHPIKMLLKPFSG
ncbi:hypothetical protein A3Q56_07719, partial [Intoshia linei]